MQSKGSKFLEMYSLKENKNKNRRKNKIKPCISFLNSSIELNICESIMTSMNLHECIFKET